MNNWIVIPTYNEIGNLEPLLQEIFAIYQGSVLIVDDNSPDGTGQLAEQLIKRWPNLAVLHRASKMGLGSAYRAGFQYVLDRGAVNILQMDADQSHDPVVIPAMLIQLVTADLVLGSRYVAGGSFPIVWYRRSISTIGNLYIRLLLGWPIHDWSTGFKAWRAPLLKQLLTQPTSGTGYAWLMEMTWLAKQRGAKILEWPIIFRDRAAGQSKFNWRIAVEDIHLAWRLSRRGHGLGQHHPDRLAGQNGAGLAK